MHTPTPAQLLQVWERGGDQSTAAISLALLGCCCSEYTEGDLAALSLGQRDALLMDLRIRLFGQDIHGVANCPHCAATVETTFRCEDLLSVSAGREPADHARQYFSKVHDTHVVFRVVNSSDLLALEHCADTSAARQVLLDRCILAAEVASKPRAIRSFPPELQAEISQAMEQADPQADIQLALHCPACEKKWQPAFDIARFLWSELQAWALRMLRDVDTLARAYHWHESDILALTPRRRQAYLERCTS